MAALLSLVLAAGGAAAASMDRIPALDLLDDDIVDGLGDQLIALDFGRRDGRLIERRKNGGSSRRHPLIPGGVIFL